MRSEQLDRREVQLVRFEHREYARKLPAQSSGANPQVRLVLRHVQRLDGIFEHRGKRLLTIQPASIDLTEMNQQSSGERALLSHQRSKSRHQLRIIQRT